MVLMGRGQVPHSEYSSQVVAGGYILTVPLTVPEFLATPRLPPVLITASSDLTAIGPGPWALSWVNQDDSDRQERVAFGIDDASLQEVSAWVDGKMNSGEWGWPRIFTGLEAANEFLARFQPVGAHRIIGLGMAVELVEQVLADHPDESGMGRYGYIETLRRRQPLALGGLELGYEILGEELGGEFHSWHCNHLEPLVHEKLGIEVNRYGLIDSPDAARKVTGFIGRADVPAEPVPWRPWLLVAYPAAEPASVVH